MIRLFHAAAKRTTPDQDNDIAGFDWLVGLSLYGRDRVTLADEDARRSAFAVHVIIVNHSGINRSGFDDRTFGAKVASGETNRWCQPFASGLGGRHDHVIGINAVSVQQSLPADLSAIAGMPLIKQLVPGLPRDGFGLAF